MTSVKKEMIYELISFKRIARVRNSHFFVYFNEKTHARKAHLFHVEHSFLGSAGKKFPFTGNSTRLTNKQMRSSMANV